MTSIANNTTNCHGIKLPAFPINVPTNIPMAPHATKIPGAVAFLGVRLRLMLPAPTWNNALPIPTRTTAKTVVLENIATDIIVNAQPNNVVSFGDWK